MAHQLWSKSEEGNLILDCLRENDSTWNLIHLTCRGITDVDVKTLAEVLQANTTVTTLGLNGNKITNTGAWHLLKALKINTTLVSLDLSCNDEIMDTILKGIEEIMERNKNMLPAQRIQPLHHPVVTTTLWSDSKEGKVIINRLRRNDSTQNLVYLNCMEITDVDIKTLAKALQANTTVTTVLLNGNKITTTGAWHLVKALKINTTLLSLDLSCNHDIAEPILDEIEEIMKRNKDMLPAQRIQPLHHPAIIITTLWFGSEEGNLILNRLRRNDSTQHLIYLDCRGITDADIKTLAEALQANTTVTTLGLNGNEITDVGAKKLSELLKTNTTVTTLGLNGNEITDVGAKKLATAFQANTTVTTLGLNGNEITDVGAKKVAELLEINTTLTWLDLSCNSGITNVGANDLAKALKTNTTLVSLDLSCNDGITAPFLDEIEEIMKRNNKKTFWTKLVETDVRDINFKITELSPLIRNVHDMKLF